jgi:uncharacterized membrane protein YgcG
MGSNCNTWRSVDFIKLIFLFTFILFSFHVNARNYAPILSYKCTSNSNGVWAATKIFSSLEECGSYAAAYQNSTDSTGVYSYSYEVKDNSIIIIITDSRNGNVNSYIGKMASYSTEKTCPYGGYLGSYYGVDTCMSAPECENGANADGSCKPPPPPPGCSDGLVMYEDGECAPPPDCEGFKNDLNQGLIQGGLFFDKSTSCHDRCEVTGCTPQKGCKDGVCTIIGYSCSLTGKTCDPFKLPEGGGGSDPGSGETQPGGGDSGGGTQPGGGGGDSGGSESGGGDSGDSTGGSGETGGGSGPGGGSGGNGQPGQPQPERTASASCASKSYQCSGDAIDCEIMRAVWQNRCATEWMEKENEFSAQFQNTLNQADASLVSEKDVSGIFKEKTYISERATCPSDFSISFFGRTITVPLGWFCGYLEIVKALFVSMAWLYVIRLITLGL